MTAKRPTRRLMLAALAGFVAAPACARQVPVMTVYKTPTCPCCGGWIDHVRAAGFRVEVRDLPDLGPIRARYGVPDQAASCHTGVIGDYVVEGHAPAADIQRLLSEAPRARGIAVPGMPLGSPGMEVPSGRREAYRTLLIGLDGRLGVFAEH